MNARRINFIACLTIAGSVVAAELATTPADRLNETWWAQRHEAKLALVKQEQFNLIFIGDSITHGFESGGEAVWAKYYAPRKALNLGFSGDRTEHVLWRLEHGEVDGQKPKLIVMMIGTNNTGHREDKPQDIAAGVKAILDELKVKAPSAKVLLLAIFPRSAHTTDAPRVNNEQANALIAKFADNQRVFFLNINNKLLEKDGTLSNSIMPDLLHPNANGYEIWAKAIEPSVAKLLGEPSSN
jgi:lysophospholipase L1-like esterase